MLDDSTPLTNAHAMRDAQVIEQDLTGFLGLDSLGGGDLPTLDNDADSYLLPGLTSSVSAYLVGSQLGVESEAASGINVASYNLTKDFVSQLTSGLDSFGSNSGLGSSAAAAAAGFGSQRTMSSSGDGGGLGQLGLLASPSVSRSQSLLHASPSDASSSFPNFLQPSQSSGSFSLSQFDPASSSATGAAATAGGQVTATMSNMSRQGSVGGGGGFLPGTRQMSAVYNPQQQQQQGLQPFYINQPNQRLPSVLGSGVVASGSNSGGGGGISGFGNQFVHQQLQAQTQAFHAVSQRFPSILNSGVLPAAAYQHAYNEDVRAKAAAHQQQQLQQFYQQQQQQQQRGGGAWSGTRASPSARAKAAARIKCGAALTLCLRRSVCTIALPPSRCPAPTSVLAGA